MSVLKRDFYMRDAVTVAKDLIGKVIVHKTSDGVVKGRIVETEAYMGPYDKAAHSYNHKGRDGRTSVQYKNGGYAYIYLIYGMYYCLNVVAAPEKNPQCVLIRALEPIEGIEIMKKRRKTDKLKNLCSGPGKLCAAMDVDKKLYGADLCGNEFYIEDDGQNNFEIEATKRINIDYAEEAADFLWRFIMKGSSYISVRK